MQFQARPTSDEENKHVQRALFALGYGWRGTGLDPNAVQPNAPVIFAKKDGTLIRGTDSLSQVSDYPIADCRKIVNEAKNRLTEEEVGEGLPVGLSFDIANIKLGLNPRYSRQLFDAPPERRLELAGRMKAAFLKDHYGDPEPVKAKAEPVHGDPITEDEAVAKIAETIGITPEELMGLGKKIAEVKPDPDELPVDNGLLKAAVRTLERKGYTYQGGEEWRPPLGDAEAPFRTFWMVLNPKGSMPKFRHYRSEEAQAEAIRIARKEAEGTIYVLQVVAAYTGKVDVKRALPEEPQRSEADVSDSRN